MCTMCIKLSVQPRCAELNFMIQRKKIYIIRVRNKNKNKNKNKYKIIT